MSKYDTLWECVFGDGRDQFTLSFEEIGRIAGVPIDHAGDDLGGVGLAALGRGLVATGGATVQKGLQRFLVNGDAGGDAIERAADGGGVRLAEDA